MISKESHLINLYQSAHQNNVQVNILRFNYDEVDEIVDYDGNTLILSSEQLSVSDFHYKIIENSPLGIYCRKELYENSIMILLHYYKKVHGYVIPHL